MRGNPIVLLSEEFWVHDEMIFVIGLQEAHSLHQLVIPRGQGAACRDGGGHAAVLPDEKHHRPPQGPLRCCGEATLDQHGGQGSCWICHIQGQSLDHLPAPIAGLVKMLTLKTSQLEQTDYVCLSTWYWHHHKRIINLHPTSQHQTIPEMRVEQVWRQHCPGLGEMILCNRLEGEADNPFFRASGDGEAVEF